MVVLLETVDQPVFLSNEDITFKVVDDLRLENHEAYRSDQVRLEGFQMVHLFGGEVGWLPHKTDVLEIGFIIIVFLNEPLPRRSRNIRECIAKTSWNYCLERPRRSWEVASTLSVSLVI